MIFVAKIQLEHGDKLIQQMKDAGMKSISEKTGIDLSSLYNFSSGQTFLSLQKVKAIYYLGLGIKAPWEE